MTFNGMPVSWRSRLQGVVSLSSAEAEVYALTDGIIEGLHMSYVAEELGLRSPNTMLPVYCDSQAAIGFQKNGGGGKSRMKHLDLRSGWLKQMKDGMTSVEYIRTDDNPADHFTKLTNSRQQKDWMEKHMAREQD